MKKVYFKKFQFQLVIELLFLEASEVFEKNTFNLNETIYGIYFNHTDVLHKNTEGIGLEIVVDIEYNIVKPY